MLRRWSWRGESKPQIPAVNGQMKPNREHRPVALAIVSHVVQAARYMAVAIVAGAVSVGQERSPKQVVLLR